MDFRIPILIICGMFLQGCFIFSEYKKSWVVAVILKGMASFVFVLLGIICSLRLGFSGYSRLIIAGLILGLFGDVFLNLRHVFKKIGDKIFLIGVASFLAGHIIYLVAVFPKASHTVIDIIIGAIISAALLAYIFKTMKVKTAFKIFGVFYLGAIIIMTVMAIDAAILLPTTKNLLFAFGAILFTASDIVLIFNTFSGNETFPRRVTNLSLYYIAQICIAITCLFTV